MILKHLILIDLIFGFSLARGLEEMGEEKCLAKAYTSFEKAESICKDEECIEKAKEKLLTQKEVCEQAELNKKNLSQSITETIQKVERSLEKQGQAQEERERIIQSDKIHRRPAMIRYCQMQNEKWLGESLHSCEELDQFKRITCIENTNQEYRLKNKNCFVDQE